MIDNLHDITSRSYVQKSPGVKKIFKVSTKKMTNILQIPNSMFK